MTFTDAAAFVMPFGKYHGQTIDAIATSDAGLRWLDWLRGDIERTRGSRGNGGETLEALRAYLDDPTIAAELTKLARGHA